MKIAIDVRALQDKIHSGVQEYLLNLLKNILEIDQKNEYILFSAGYKKFNHQKLQNLVEQHKSIEIKHLRLPNKLIAVCWRFLNWPNLDEFLGKPDLLFAPNLNILPKDILKKTVITFHDLSFKRFNEFFSLKSKLWHNYINPTMLAKDSRAIIAVSESTKQDIKKFYKVKDEKIYVIALGRGEGSNDFEKIKNSKKILKKTKNKYNLPDKFILYLGTLEPRKNIIGIIKAYNLIRKNPYFAQYGLVLAGPKGWLFRKTFQEIEKSCYKKDIIVTGALSQEEKLIFYTLASVLIYPSFFEGFGLPPLEAMSYGLPVVTSNRSSLPSVVGDAGIIVDPYSIGSLAWAIEEILRDRSLYQKLKKRGLERAKFFSWRETAKETLKLFGKA